MPCVVFMFDILTEAVPELFKKIIIIIIIIIIVTIIIIIHNADQT